MGKKILILFPDGWRVEECCVKSGSTIAPTAPLVLSAYLRKLGHHPLVAPHPVIGSLSFKMGAAPDAMIIYAPWHAFSTVTVPMIQAVKNEYPGCITIMVMYETLSNFETSAMKECQELDYTVIPNEKEISVGEIINHGHPRCPGGFGNRAGIIYRDENNLPRNDGKRPFANNLSHLPYAGDELRRFIASQPANKYDRTAILLERGCPKTCTFCPIRTTRARYRDPETAAMELETAIQIFGKRGVTSLAHEAFHKKDILEQFADHIISRKLDLTWDIGARCDLIDDPELLRKLKIAGVKNLYFGIETATEEGRQKVQKPIKDIDIERAINYAEQAGLAFHAAFMIGFPWEDDDYMVKMKEMLCRITHKNNCGRYILSKLVPFPGLPIEKEVVEAGIIPRLTTFDDWNRPDENSCTIVRRTKNLDHYAFEKSFNFVLSDIKKPDNN
ncbi:MAG: radical SAM protein [Candidatus Zixiibacteriota bacterium]